jgi:hypothetical protein
VTGTALLALGSRLVLDQAEWAVASWEPQFGRVLLVGGDGRARPLSIRTLVNHPDFVAMAASPSGRPRGELGDLTDYQRAVVTSRYAHLLEVETGYRGGNPLRPGPGEPREGYDPAVTTLGGRRRAKVAELGALPPEDAALLGLARVSERTLERLAADCRRFGIAGCVSGYWVRRSGPRWSITPQTREAVFAVRAETLHRSRVSMKTKERMIHQYVAEKFGDEVKVPSSETLRTVWLEWFGPGGSRQRYARSAARLEQTGEHVVVHRPGQVVALDTTELAVLVRDGVFGEPVAAHLTLALDVYTHSIVAFRLTLVSDTSVDVAMLLRDVMMPLPLRDGWGEDMEWPYPGVPAELVAEFAGHRVAGLPFFAPETVTTDHGSVYKNHHLVDVQRVIGANILPARVLRPTDKQAVERTFSGIQSLLLEILPGYRGVDVADRGADPEGDAVLTLTEMEHLVATWIVKVWQNRELGEFAPAWDPDSRHSPNTLFAAAMAQGGFALQVPAPQLYYELLPSHVVTVHGRRGVKVQGLWYDGPALDPYRDGPSTRGGKHKGTWAVRRDPRDRRAVFFQDPGSGAWHGLRWVGLPPEGEVPAFGDARVVELLRAARAEGLTPRSDAELLPLLLDLVGARIPVSAWLTQTDTAQRTRHAREASQSAAASADRPAPPGGGAEVIPLRPGRGQQVADAVDSERRRRREEAMAGRTVTPPPPLGATQRRRSLLTLPADGEAGDRDGAAPGPGGRP